MPKKVKKVFGDTPETVNVLSTQVTFDENGDAEVEDDIADVLAQIPGYEVAEDHIDGADNSAEEEVENSSEEDEEEETEVEAEVPSEAEEAEETPKPKRPTRKAPTKR